MIGMLALAVTLAATPPPQTGDGWAGILAALELPALVTEARRTGITETTLRRVLDGLLGRGVTADDAVVVLREELDAVHAGGPRDNFGAFVQQKLAAGLRGRALAEAIRAEHRKSGIGKRNK